MGFLAGLKDTYRILSIVGMAKNSGKTTALNALLEEAYDEGLVLGVTSTGRDGESIDLVSGTDKPRIFLFEGTLVTVPDSLYELSQAGLEILRRTDCHTAMGPVLICRVARSGYVQIAGPGSVQEHRRLCQELLALGADMILIDGAIDRKSIADPRTSDGVILSTGAVLSRSLNIIVRETAHVVSLYSTRQWEDERGRALLEDAAQEGFCVALIDRDYRLRQLPLRTALGAGQVISDSIDEQTRYVYLSGALTESILAGIQGDKLAGLTLILPDPTRIFVGAVRWQQFLKKGLEVRVLRNIAVAAVTVNPVAPAGYAFDHAAFKEAVAGALPGIPVYDVYLEGFDRGDER